MDKLKRPRLLRIFLCHSSDDKPVARDLYDRLLSDGMQPWLDEKNLLPGQDWELEIRKAVKNTDVVIVCLSKGSINKRGFVQKETTFALDVADEQPEGTIFLIPLRLDKCDVPQRLRTVQWVDYFEPGGYLLLIAALKQRSDELIVPLLPQSINRATEELLASIMNNDKEARKNYINAFRSLSSEEYSKHDQFIFDLYIANDDAFLLLVERHLSDLDRLKYQISVYTEMGKAKQPQSKQEMLMIQSRWLVGWLFRSGFIKKDGNDIIVNEHMKNTLDNLITFLRARNRFTKRDEREAEIHANIVNADEIGPR